MTTINRAAALIAALTLSACATAGADSDNARIATSAGPIGDIAVPVQSFESLRFASVVRQRYDFSCGSAALATLLRYHYGGRQDEETVFRGMWIKGDRAQIRRLGFSLLDMKRYLAAIGFTAEGFEVSLDDIAKAGVPGIALVNLKNYRHFVVIKGVTADEVLIGDPSLGLRTMPRSEFSAAWNGIYFVLNDHMARGRASFNHAAQWARLPRAPIGSRFADPISQQALMLSAPGFQDF